MVWTKLRGVEIWGTLGYSVACWIVVFFSSEWLGTGALSRTSI